MSADPANHPSIDQPINQPISSETTISHRSITATTNQTDTPTTVHVLYGLAGKHDGFFAEFHISFKSVLLNAPVHAPLVIHIMATQQACDRIQPFLQQFKTWRTRPAISIRLHNVQPHVATWRAFLLQNVFPDVPKQVVLGHTMGSYFRLFCHEVLQAPSVLYLDTDVVVTAPLDRLWQYISTTDQHVFAWGPEIQCSGFLILTPSRLSDFWQSILAQRPLARWSDRLDNVPNDQLLLRLYQHQHPTMVGALPLAYDVSLAKLWNAPLQQSRPDGVAMLHFNGGGKSKENVFASDHAYLKQQHTWGMANYYIHLSWNWTQFIVESSCVDSLCSTLSVF